MWISSDEHKKEMDRNRYPIIEKFRQEIYRMQTVQIEPALIICDPEHFYMLSEELNQFMTIGSIVRPMRTEHRFYMATFSGFTLLIQEIHEFKGINILGRIPDPEFDKNLTTRLKENHG